MHVLVEDEGSSVRSSLRLILWLPMNSVAEYFIQSRVDL